MAQNQYQALPEQPQNYHQPQMAGQHQPYGGAPGPYHQQPPPQYAPQYAPQQYGAPPPQYGAPPPPQHTHVVVDARSGPQIVGPNTKFCVSCRNTTHYRLEKEVSCMQICACLCFGIPGCIACCIDSCFNRYTICQVCGHKENY